jgi:uncharacterized membrane protein
MVEILLAYLITLAIGLLLLAMPALSRGSTFLAVTVPDGFPDSALGQALLGRYRSGVLVATALALAVMTPQWWLLDYQHAVVSTNLTGPLVAIFGALAAFIHCRNRTLESSLDHSSRRSVVLAPPPRLAEIVPRPLWLHGLPYLILVAAAAWLAINWGRIPDPMMVPGQMGGPDVAQARTVAAVFAVPLLMAVTIALMHAVMPLALLIRRLPGHQSRILTINHLLLRLMLVVAALGAWNALAVLYGPQWITGPAGITVNVLAAVLVVVLPVAMLYSGRFSRPGQPHEGDRSPDHCWKLGMFYFNPDDPALWVEKRFGLGYTINFARPAAWLLVAAILGFTAALVWLAWS